MNARTLRITLAAQALLIVWLALPQAAVAAFTDNGNGTVTDTVTGLMWDRCSQGQSGAACATGTASTMTWPAALTAAVTANTANYKGYNDWRLPNKNELESLVDIPLVDILAFTNPAINPTAFPATPEFSDYWSSTTNMPVPTEAWFVYFQAGASYGTAKTNSCQVRLVRSGQ